MKAYKLVRKMKSGKLRSLFINKSIDLPLNTWIKAESYPTKGFAIRPGWHCTFKPIAPHLSTKNRVWVEVELKNTQTYNRPESQGGCWILAEYMKIIKELKD